MGAVSMRDIAAHAGVSARTVSNVVNNNVHVATATRERVRASLVELGYRPNAAARSLRSGRTNAVTLAIPGLGERYFADLADSMIRSAGRLGLKVFIETTDGHHDAEQAILVGQDRLLTDGVIMSALTLGDADMALVPDHPLVLVGDRALGASVDHVRVPNRRAARAAVEHLIAQGCRAVALLGGPESIAVNSYWPRRQGWADALRAAGLPSDDSLLLGGRWLHSEGERLVGELVRRGGRLPDGIFAVNDSLALGALKALAGAGVRVPADVAVIGFDDVREASTAFPALSSVAPDRDEMARLAIDLLRRQVARGRSALGENCEVSFTVKERASSRRMAP